MAPRTRQQDEGHLQLGERISQRIEAISQCIKVVVFNCTVAISIPLNAVISQNLFCMLLSLGRDFRV